MPHVARNSGNNDWYTPQEFTDAARDVLGGIDLDPASCAEANTVVRATRYFDIDVDGRAQEWGGRVWLNPPYAQPLIADFAEAVATKAYRAAIVLVNNATETAWFHRMCERASAICFPRGRVRFWGPEGRRGAPLQGQALIYVGDDPEHFGERFAEFGLVVRL